MYLRCVKVAQHCIGGGMVRRVIQTSPILMRMSGGAGLIGVEAVMRMLSPIGLLAGLARMSCRDSRHGGDEMTEDGQFAVHALTGGSAGTGAPRPLSGRDPSLAQSSGATLDQHLVCQRNQLRETSASKFNV